MVTRKQAEEAEKRLFLDGKIQAKHFHQENIYTISQEDYISCIILDKVPKKSGKQMLLIHGYNACKGNMFRLAEILHEYFYLIIIDLPGMNLSHKPNKTPFKCQETALSYFIANLIVLVNKMQLKNFYLAGHSLGAYISSNLFEMLHQNIKKLLLISPGGFNLSEQDEYEYQIKKLEKEKWWLSRKIISYYGLKIFKEKKSTSEFMFFKPLWLIKYLIKKRFKFTDKQAENLAIVTKFNLDSKPCGEKCLGYLFDYGIRSKKPIIHIIEQNKARSKDIVLFWGENDYMDKEETKQKLNEKKINIKTYIVPKSKHSLQNENYIYLAEKMLEFLLNKKINLGNNIQEQKPKYNSQIYNQNHIKDKQRRYNSQMSIDTFRNNQMKKI